MTEITRRQFLKSGAVALSLAGGLKLGLAPRIAQAAWMQGHFVLYVFLRGGIDGLNLVVPIDGNDRAQYEQKRPNIKILTSGTYAALPLGPRPFGLHWAATGLRDLFNEGDLAIVQATGLPLEEHSRSHFDAQAYMEHGTPGSTSIGTGWLARHLAVAGQVPGNATIPALTAGSTPPVSLSGEHGLMTLDDTSSFHPNADSNYGPSFLTSLREIYDGSDDLDLAVHGAIDTVDLIQSLDLGSYTPAGGATYPSTGVGTSLGNQCKLVANIASRDLGLQVATIDFGGWDTHQNQGNSEQALAQNGYGQRIDALSQALTALYTDLRARNLHRRLLVVVQSEFGRRLKENDNRGTDHGTGNPMFVLGGRVNGGLYGTFPGLAPEQLYDGNDLRTTTDFRRVLSEVVQSHLGNSDLAAVFPGYSYTGPLGLLPGDPIFANGFQ